MPEILTRPDTRPETPAAICARIHDEHVRRHHPPEPPTVRYEFRAPVLFDCRDAEPRRRVGLGDTVVVVHVLQAIARHIGGEVRVAYDPETPAAAIWRMAADLDTYPVPGSARLVTPEGWQYIAMRRHPLAHPTGRHRPSYAGEEAGYPGAQVLFNLGGWGDFVPWFPVRPRFTPSVPPRGDYVACQPLEYTRSNAYATPARFRAALDQLGDGPIVYGAAPGEYPRLAEFIAGIGRPGYVALGGLAEWYQTIAGARAFVTGNTAGLWLALGTDTPTAIIETPISAHAEMWAVKPSWGAPHVHRWEP